MSLIDLEFKRPIATFGEKVILEKSDRQKNIKDPLEYGVSFLDAVTEGITKNDLIIIGAKTGTGKTQLATLIAMTNARKGKRVHYYALEAENFEIERRIKYRMLAEKYLSMNRYDKVRISYPSWYRCKLDHVFEKIEPEINEMLGTIYSSLFTIYGHGNFTIEDFEKSFLAIQDQTDLVIIDHLHYFDFDDTNENRAYKRIVKSIHDLALHVGKPVILVAHMRKSDKKEKTLLPGIEDFHGTSDIPKIATTAIVIGPCKNSETGDPTLWKTYMRVAKLRMDMSRTHYAAQTCFDVKTQGYEKHFVFGRFVNFDEEFEALSENQTPEWAKQEKGK